MECIGQSLIVKNTVCLNHYISAPVPVFPEYQPLTPLGDRLYVGKYEGIYFLMINNGYLWVVKLGMVCVCVCTFCLFTSFAH